MHRADRHEVAQGQEIATCKPELSDRTANKDSYTDIHWAGLLGVGDSYVALSQCHGVASRCAVGHTLEGSGLSFRCRGGFIDLMPAEIRHQRVR